MSLPSHYIKPEGYFIEAIAFLHEYSWIYQHSNTSFIKAGVLEKFPKDFSDYFLTITNEELNNFPFLTNEDGETTKPPEVKIFPRKLKHLIPAQAFIPPMQVKKNDSIKVNLTKMNQKKQHEISLLAELITRLCEENQLLIDFGAGLGYLSEMLLRRNEKFLILGLESEEERVEAATKRLKEFMPSTYERVNYKHQFITEESLDFIKENAHSMAKDHHINPPKMTIIGLHACADLTITAIRLFFQMGPRVARLIIMPCCYHKLKMDPLSLRFVNFPLSEALKKAVSLHSNYEAFLNRPFLRLACQQTMARWQNTSSESHKAHGLEMFLRGVAEAIIDEESENVVKRKRELNKKNKKNPMIEFDGSFKTFCDIFELHSKDTKNALPWTDFHESKFIAIYGKFYDGSKLAEGLTCLQTAMQKLCENVVLYDRLCFIHEYASAHNLPVTVRYEKLLDEKLSPRCYVLIAEKF